jgi:hypothetical protein
MSICQTKILRIAFLVVAITDIIIHLEDSAEVTFYDEYVSLYLRTIIW